jgi:hypothetical protein
MASWGFAGSASSVQRGRFGFSQLELSDQEASSLYFYQIARGAHYEELMQSNRFSIASHSTKLFLQTSTYPLHSLAIQLQQGRSSSGSNNSEPQHAHIGPLADLQPTRCTREGRDRRARRRRTRRIRTHQRLARREVLPTQKLTHRLCISQMDAMQQRGAERRVRGAEVDGEVEGASQAATGLDDRRPVVVAVEADVVGGQGDGRHGWQVERVDLFVGPVGRLRVDEDGLDDVRAEDVVGARCADGVYSSPGWLVMWIQDLRG